MTMPRLLARFGAPVTLLALFLFSIAPQRAVATHTVGAQIFWDFSAAYTNSVNGLYYVEYTVYVELYADGGAGATIGGECGNPTLAGFDWHVNPATTCLVAPDSAYFTGVWQPAPINIPNTLPPQTTTSCGATYEGCIQGDVCPAISGFDPCYQIEYCCEKANPGCANPQPCVCKRAYQRTFRLIYASPNEYTNGNCANPNADSVFFHWDQCCRDGCQCPQFCNGASNCPTTSLSWSQGTYSVMYRGLEGFSAARSNSPIVPYFYKFSPTSIDPGAFNPDPFLGPMNVSLGLIVDDIFAPGKPNPQLPNLGPPTINFISPNDYFNPASCCAGNAPASTACSDQSINAGNCPSNPLVCQLNPFTRPLHTFNPALGVCEDIVIDPLTGVSNTFTPSLEGAFGIGYYFEKYDNNGNLHSRVLKEAINQTFPPPVVVPAGGGLAGLPDPPYQAIQDGSPFITEFNITLTDPTGNKTIETGGPTDLFVSAPNKIIDVCAGTNIQIELSAEDTSWVEVEATRICPPNIGTVSTIRFDSKLKLTWNADQSAINNGATFSPPDVFKPSPLTDKFFSWTPTQPGVYSIRAQYENDLCPLTRDRTYIFQIRVTAPVTINNVAAIANCTQVEFVPDLTINPTPGVTPQFQWSTFGLVPTDGQTQDLTHSYDDIGTYPYTLTIDYGGCVSSFTDQVSLTEGLKLVNGAGSGATVCENQQLVLGPTETGPFQVYQWFDDAGNPFSTAVNPSVTATNNLPGGLQDTLVYRLEASSTVTNCTFTDSVTFIVNPTYDGLITGSFPTGQVEYDFCEDNSEVITLLPVPTPPSGTAVSYFWAYPFPDQTSPVQTLTNSLVGLPNNPLPTALTGYVTVGGCISEPVSLNVNPIPKPEPEFTLFGGCDGQDAIVVASGADEYSWGNLPVDAIVSGIGGGTVTLPNFTTSQTLTLTGVTLTNQASNCPGDALTVEVPLVPASNPDFDIATGAAVFPSGFNATACSDVDPVTFTYTGELPPAGVTQTYAWSLGQGALPGAAETMHVVGVEYLSSGTKTVRLVVTRNGTCTDTVVHELGITPQPVADFVLDDPDNALCEDQLLTVTETSDYGDYTGNVNIEWLFEGGVPDQDQVTARPGYSTEVMFMPDPNTGIYNPPPNDLRTITLTVGAGNCVDAISKEVLVSANPVPPSFDPTDPMICQGFFGEVAAVEPTGPYPPIRYHWYTNPSGTNEIFVGDVFTTPNRLNRSTTYYVAAENRYGCFSALEPIEISVFPVTQQEITAVPTDLELPTAITTFTPVGDNQDAITSWYWDFGDGSTSDLREPSHQYTEPGTYTIVLQTVDENGCIASDLKYDFISVGEQVYIIIPTAFSPNDDGNNDYITPGVRLIDDLTINIYSRLGTKVFESNDPQFKWNGQLNGNGSDLPEGVYTYVISAKAYNGEAVEQTGTITLVR